MRYSTGLLAAYLALRPRTIIAPDCFTITLANGNPYFYTNADIDVSFYNYDTTNADSALLSLGNLGSMVLAAAGEAPVRTFKSNSVRISGLKYSCKIGVDVDEQDVTMAVATPPTFAQAASTAVSGDLGTGDLGQMILSDDGIASPTFGPSQELIEGVPFLQALRQGLFDGAYLQRDRAFLYAWGAPPIGTVTLFYGRISSIDKIGRTEAQMKVKSALVALDSDFPRNIYQASCIHTLYDAGCTLAKSSFANAGTVGAGSTDQVIAWTNPQSQANYFNEGTIAFSSGDLAGYTANIKASTASTIIVVDSLPVAPQPGDIFTAYPGCDHTIGLDASGNPISGNNGCAKFANTAHFRGFDQVPPPATAF
jgi:uncharacterized phage protein (TIGR02218 family)